jgi:hypothetical protein
VVFPADGPWRESAAWQDALCTRHQAFGRNGLPYGRDHDNLWRCEIESARLAYGQEHSQATPTATAVLELPRRNDVTELIINGFFMQRGRRYPRKHRQLDHAMKRVTNGFRDDR